MTDAGGVALVIGASGGIGAALAERWVVSGQFHQVLRTRRAANSDGDFIPLDLTEEESIRAAAATVAEASGASSLRQIAICTGVLHGDGFNPERRLVELDARAFEHAVAVNALGPLLIAKHFSALLPKNYPSALAAISARVGSISDNRLGGWYSYRASKAALNQGYQTLAIELRRSRPQCVVTLFHPGTVDTSLSQPFQKKVPAEKLFSPERAARQMDEVLQARSDPHAPIFVDWAGKTVAF